MTLSHISNKEISKGEIVKGEDIRAGIYDLIKTDFPDFSHVSIISVEELNKYRRLYLTRLVEQEKGEIAVIDMDVMNAIRDNSILSENLQDEAEGKLTLGQRVADHIATFGGSWTFIISFFSFLILWIAINILMLTTKAFDPYPFILLNLILSCLAAIQAPIIMMSQNRQAKKDSLRNKNDYKTDLKSELILEELHDQMTKLAANQNKILKMLNENEDKK